MTRGDGPLTAVITLSSSGRLSHLRRQQEALGGRSGLLRIVVWIGDDEPPSLDAEIVHRVAPGRDGLRLAAARNAGAARAIAEGADLLVFLDADCVPGPHLFERYRAAAENHPNAILCGPVTYLAEGVDVVDSAALDALTSPHPARPSPADGATVPASPSEYPLFWSLSFATSDAGWRGAPDFDEGYEGYGGEDTDFAFALRDRGIPLMWVGGAHAYHQHHPTQSPPWQHLDDILRNGARFARRWGEWPMTGWLERFEEAGAVVHDSGGWRRA